MSDSGDQHAQAYHLGFRAQLSRQSRSNSSPSASPSPPPLEFEEARKELAAQCFDVLRGVCSSVISVKDLSGPIGIPSSYGQVVHDAAEAPGWMPLIGTMAMISINLGMFNLLPFPILDGGMIFLLLVESLFQRDLPMPIQGAHLPGRLRLHSTAVHGDGDLQRHH